ncbi:MAG: geranylgeranylglyceryl/heptaprenylglyceryl phosphate synthase [DPANN group archaeon]|nr:geranylgeranylglyceryl/heptaprenylglyceryl phosphate synthase [DPANN group archaeon]
MIKYNVEKYINEIKETKKGVFMGVIDPDPMKQTPEKSLDLAKKLYEGGADLVLLGGSIGAQGAALDKTAKLIKENIDIPVHLFPGNTGTVTKYADSIYFMSLLNSSNPYWVMGAPLLGAPVIKRYGLEPIPTAYLVFEPGQTVGWVGESRLLPRTKPDLAVVYSMAAEFMGMRFVILESGSGAPEPVPSEIVAAIKKYTDLNIVVAGGVKTPRQAFKLIKSGATGIHIGTKIEDAKDPEKKIKEFEEAIHQKKSYW